MSMPDTASHFLRVCGLAVFLLLGAAVAHASELDELRKAAKQGDMVAQKNLGDAYYNGKGVSQDYKEGVKWWRKAAKQGYAPAQNKLGQAYAIGIGVPPSY